MDYSSMSPAEVRALIREGKITGPTAGMCAGYAQANLVILPKDLAYDFLLFTQRNPKSCPLLEVSDVGGKGLSYLGKNVDIYKDIPKYRIYENGELTGEYTDVSRFYREDLVSFLIGCSFSFESELLEAGIPVRHIEEGWKYGRKYASDSSSSDSGCSDCDSSDAESPWSTGTDRLSGSNRYQRYQ